MRYNGRSTQDVTDPMVQPHRYIGQSRPRQKRALEHLGPRLYVTSEGYAARKRVREGGEAGAGQRRGERVAAN